MNTKEILERLSGVIADITSLYGDLSNDMPQLRIVVDNTRESELKKILGIR